MKKRYLLIGMLLSGILGWTLGFLRLPHLEKNTSFLMGFLSCLAVILIGVLLLLAWNNNIRLLRWMEGRDAAKDRLSPRNTYTLIWLLFAIFIVLGGAVSSLLIYQQNRFYKDQIRQQNEKIDQQLALLEAARQSNLIVLNNQLLADINAELASKPDRSLSKETISRIAALNYSFKPHRYLEKGRLSEQKLSPERGQLLVILSGLNMDTSSFNQVKQQTSFNYADLRGADLSGVDLSGADLKWANFKDADLSKANLNQADLNEAYLWGTNLRKANLQKATLEKANLQWADLVEANLNRANMNGVKMRSAKMTRADLRGATITYADLSSTFLNEAVLTNADLSFTNLSSANLSIAVLKEAVMKTTNLSSTVLDKANMQGVNLRWGVIDVENWFEKLENWQVKGKDDIQKRYNVIPDEAGLGNYRLLPKE